ncbi:MAG: hypothetical protein IJ192_06715 [Clostridia bacterium]|nr:hypothetical protein [Clostridia bacterium]
MKNDCSVVKDLIPLYAEGLVSSETKEFIYEHCQSCEKCKDLLEAITHSSDGQETTDNKKEKIWNEIASKERRKKKVKYIVLSFVATFLVLSIVFIYSFFIKGNTWFTQYDLTYTEQTINQSNFSENDINAAAEEVKQYFKNNFGGCVLLRLSYDEENTLDQEWHREYSEAICFKSDYYMLKEPVAGVMNRNRNNWNWTVLHDSDGSWRVVNYGYC